MRSLLVWVISIGLAIGRSDAGILEAAECIQVRRDASQANGDQWSWFCSQAKVLKYAAPFFELKGFFSGWIKLLKEGTQKIDNCFSFNVVCLLKGRDELTDKMKAYSNTLKVGVTDRARRAFLNLSLSHSQHPDREKILNDLEKFANACVKQHYSWFG